MATMSLAKPLAAAGFEPDDDLRTQLEGTAELVGMHTSGPYQVLGAWRRGDVAVHVEQNTDQLGAHPPVAVVEGPHGRVAVNLSDPSADRLLGQAIDDVSHPAAERQEAR
jgi:hypothetical protein